MDRYKARKREDKKETRAADEWRRVRISKNKALFWEVPKFQTI